MSWLLVLVFLWLIGAGATAGATSVIGNHNPNTIGDSFSGDDFVDAAIVVFWPAFWPSFAAYRAAAICIAMVSTGKEH